MSSRAFLPTYLVEESQSVHPGGHHDHAPVRLLASRVLGRRGVPEDRDAGGEEGEGAPGLGEVHDIAVTEGVTDSEGRDVEEVGSEDEDDDDHDDDVLEVGPTDAGLCILGGVHARLQLHTAERPGEGRLNEHLSTVSSFTTVTTVRTVKQSELSELSQPSELYKPSQCHIPSIPMITLQTVLCFRDYFYSVGLSWCPGDHHLIVILPALV